MPIERFEVTLKKSMYEYYVAGENLEVRFSLIIPFFNYPKMVFIRKSWALFSALYNFDPTASFFSWFSFYQRECVRTRDVPEISNKI